MTRVPTRQDQRHRISRRLSGATSPQAWRDVLDEATADLQLDDDDRAFLAWMARHDVDALAGLVRLLDLARAAGPVTS